MFLEREADNTSEPSFSFICNLPLSNMRIPNHRDQSFRSNATTDSWLSATTFRVVPEQLVAMSGIGTTN